MNRVLLCILDGFGLNDKDQKNAILHAKKPNLDFLFKNYPFTTLEAGGELVGLPKGVAGNSEVGHLNLGSGRSVRQDLVRINEAIDKNNFKDLPKWKELINSTRNGSKRLHLLGLLSDGSVHSHINHLKHILLLLKQEKDIQVFLHAFMDGRDTGQTKGLGYLEDILKIGGFTLASLQGRSVGMDRDRRWEKIKNAYEMMIGLQGTKNISALDYIKEEYSKNIYDEFITPALINTDGAIKNEDSIFFFNFRPDRAKQISLAFNDPNFNEFKISVRPKYFLCLSPYLQDELPNLPILFDKEKIPGTLAEYLAGFNKKQYKIAETEKYAHVTYFFNGGEEKSFRGEERKLVPSPKEVKTYDLKPQMSAFEVKNELLLKLKDANFSLYVVNFANCDMVGHTGNYEATIKAVEGVDQCVGELSEFCLKENIYMIVTADHGNADQMIYPDGSLHTSHTEAKVPFSLSHSKLRGSQFKATDYQFSLRDVAPTILSLLQLEMPSNFSGRNIEI